MTSALHERQMFGPSRAGDCARWARSIQAPAALYQAQGRPQSRAVGMESGYTLSASYVHDLPDDHWRGFRPPHFSHPGAAR